jgi:(R)-2-hydroxyacyl-CoA dehydratese activating ATPase
MNYYLGVDIGSVNSKGVVLDATGILASITMPSGINYVQVSEKLLAALLDRSGLNRQQIRFTVATGQGAASVAYSNQSVTDMRCCARGIHHLFPAARTVIDIQGQSTLVMRLGSAGQIAGFLSSEKCASGSGYFLEMISNVLQVPLTELGPLSLKSHHPVTFTTACAVFGESEAVSRIAEGVSAEDIAAGVHRAMAEKIGAMVERLGLEEAYAVCGGGALDSGLVKTLEDVIKVNLLVLESPQVVTALGAALFAREMANPEK